MVSSVSYGSEIMQNLVKMVLNSVKQQLRGLKSSKERPGKAGRAGRGGCGAAAARQAPAAADDRPLAAPGDS